jgi:hypothetical protein
MDCHNLVLKLFFKIKKSKKKSKNMFSMHFDHQRDHFAIFNYFSLVDVFLKKIKFKEIYFRCICIHFSFLDYFSFQIEVNVAFHEKTKIQKKEKRNQNSEKMNKRLECKTRIKKDQSETQLFGDQVIERK